MFLEHDCLGHVVFYPTKPACFSAISKIPHRDSEQILLNGWKCWKQYEYLFPHPNYLFIEEEFLIQDEVVLHIFLINKKTLLTSL